MSPDEIQAHGTTYVRRDLVKERYDTNLFGEAATEAAPTRFEEMWQAWPKRGGTRVGKKQAIDQYARAVKSGVSETTLINQAAVYAEKCGDYPKDCFRWIRDKNYLDEIESAERTEQSPEVLAFWEKKIRGGGKIFGGVSNTVASQLITTGRFTAKELKERDLI